jgi:hypothetical protein
MHYDVIISGNKEKVGIGTFSHVSRAEFAEHFAMDVNTVFQGNYRRTGNLLRRGKLGKPYTYSSSAGEMDMMLLIPLSDFGDEMSYVHTTSDGGMTFYPTDYHAEKAGVNISECKEIPLSMAVQMAGLKSDAPMVMAIKKRLLGGV